MLKTGRKTAASKAKNSGVSTQHERRTGETWNEHAYIKLRRDILSGTLKPDTRLKIEDLKARYQVGPTPIREALSRLSSEGLVHVEQLKGYRVAPVSLRELTELCELRVIIETEALKQSIQNGDSEWESQIVASYYLLDQLEQRLAEGETIDPAKWEDRNRDFHDAITAAATSQWLMRMRQNLWDHHERYRRHGKELLVQQPRAAVHEEHHDMMQAALDRDFRKVARIMRKHILFTIDLLKPSFEQH